jgi:uncharacterized protein (TIGR03083 family)
MSVRDLLRGNDIRFGTVAASLTLDDWTRPSLCDAWSNHDVLAHLVIGYQAGLRVTATEMLRHAGSFDRANAAMARTTARVSSPAELLAEFEKLVNQPRGLGRIFPPRLLLGDHVTHELDIMLAIDRQPAIASDAAVAVLNTQVSVPNPFVPAFRNSRGLRLRATDVEWTYGEGPIVEGRAVELISVLGNRPRMLSCLSGDGVELLAARVHP